MTDEQLIQPGDSTEGENLPPTFSPGNLPPGKPVDAVPKAREQFYGPVSGPFAVRTENDILQVGTDWRGYIRKDAFGFVAPVSIDAFEAGYTPIEDLVEGKTSPLGFTPDLELVADVAPALRRQAVRIQYQAALEQTLQELVASGVIPENIDELEAEAVDSRPDAAEASEAIGVEQADRYDEDGEREAAEAALEAQDDIPSPEAMGLPGVEGLTTDQLIAVMNGDYDAFPDAGQYEIPAAFGQLQAKAADGDEQATTFVAAVEAATPPDES